MRFGTLALLMMGLLHAQAPDWGMIDELNDDKQFDEAYSLLAAIPEDLHEGLDYLWRMARHHFNNSDNSTDEAVIEQEIYAGFEYAKKALAIGENSADANGWYGILIGRVGEIEGTEQKIRNSYQVRDHTVKAVELDPDNDTWTHVMGRWHFTLADLSWFERTIASIVYAKPPQASFEEAETYFKAAIEADPMDIRHYLWLGKTQLELDNDAAAKANFEQAISLEAKADSDRILQDEAATLLKKLK